MTQTRRTIGKAGSWWFWEMKWVKWYCDNAARRSKRTAKKITARQERRLMKQAARDATT